MKKPKRNRDTARDTQNRAADSRRGRVRKIGRLLPWLIAITAGIGAVVLIRGVAGPRIIEAMRRSSLFVVRSVHVTIKGGGGDRHEVIKAAGIDSGMHQLDIDPRETARRIQSLPWVGKVRIARLVPHTVRIGVTARTPMAYVCAGHVYWTDNTGALVAMTPGFAESLPVVTGLAAEMDSLGTRLSQESLRRLLAFFESVRGAGKKFPAVHQVDFAHNGTVRIRLREYPATVQLRESELEQRLGVLKLLMNRLRQGDGPAPTRIDLRFENLAFVE